MFFRNRFFVVFYDFLVCFLFIFLFAAPSVASEDNNLNNNLDDSQIMLLKNIKLSLENIKEDNKSKWDKYVSMQSELLYPEQPYPHWQRFISQNSDDSDGESRVINGFISSLTNNKFLQYILSSANEGYVPSDLIYPLKLGLNKSIANSSSLQVERLNAILILQNYKAQLQQNKELNRISKLLNVLIVNNYTAQQKQSRQLDKLILLFKNNHVKN